MMLLLAVGGAAIVPTHDHELGSPHSRLHIDENNAALPPACFKDCPCNSMLHLHAQSLSTQAFNDALVIQADSIAFC